jgi:TRAP-type transport system small permease protein
MLNKLLEWVCGLMGAVALFAIMALTFFDVGARKLLSNSITGSLELTELLMVIVIFSAVPLVSQRGEHVVFDSLDGLWPQWLRQLQNVLVHLLCAMTMVGLAYLMWKLGVDIAAQNETTAQLKIDKAPFIQIMSIMCGLTGCLHVGLMFQPPTEQAEGEGVAL